MNKEPIGLYIFRFVLGFGLFAFMAMLYWSSVALEENLQEMRSDVRDLKNDLFTLHEEINRVQQNVLKNTLDHQSAQSPRLTREDPPSPQTAKSSHPNLLEADLFYEKTLPNLLGPHFKAQGIFQQAAVGRPANLHPFSNWQNVSSWHSQCSVSVARQQFGKYETFAPDMAHRMERRHRASDQAVEYWIFLRDGVYWNPLTQAMLAEEVLLAPHFLRKHRVTAHDFKFYFDAIMNPYVQEPGAVAMRTFLEDLEEIVVIDDLTFVARWKTQPVKGPDGETAHKAKYLSQQVTGGLRPLASFVYKYFPNGKKILEEDSDPSAYRSSSLWAQNFQQHWARHLIPSCGPWIFKEMTDHQIQFARNSQFYDPYAILLEKMAVFFKETPNGAWQDFKANKLDAYTLRPEELIELSDFLASEPYQEQAHQGDAIKRLEYTDRSYTFIGWNQAKPFFQNKAVRQALTMAIDRERIIGQYLNGMGKPINGPFYPFSPSYDETLPFWPFDLEAAKRLLQQEGWTDTDGDGIIDKIIDGKSVPFQFSLTYYVKNPSTKAIAEYIATTLKELGIQCDLNGVDVADLSAAFDDKSFDALALGWSLGTPPEDIRQLWSSAGAKEKGSSNAIGFANAEVDEIIAELDYTFEHEERIQLYHRFDAIIHEECPYTFLYAPKAVLLYRERLQNVWIPADRQDLIPGANVAEPESAIFWIKHG